MTFLKDAVALGPQEGKPINVPGHPIRLKAVKDDTGGAYSLLEGLVTGDGPPQHIHNTEEEAFYVLEGTLNVKIGEEVRTGTPGSFFLIPRGTTHTFWNGGTEPAKLLVIFSPAGFEQYFHETVGDEEIDTATFIERGMAIASRYHLEIVGPPLG